MSDTPNNVVNLRAPRGSQYDENQIRTAMTCLVGCGGSVTHAKELLAQRGINVSKETLRRWRDVTYSNAYAELARKHGPELEEHLISEFRSLATMAANLQRRTLEQVQTRLDATDRAGHTLPPDELAKLATALSKVGGAATDKVLTLTGRPTAFTEDRTLAEILRGLQAKNVLTVESTAEEIETTALDPAEAGGRGSGDA